MKVNASKSLSNDCNNMTIDDKNLGCDYLHFTLSLIIDLVS